MAIQSDFSRKVWSSLSHSTVLSVTAMVLVFGITSCGSDEKETEVKDSPAAETKASPPTKRIEENKKIGDSPPLPDAVLQQAGKAAALVKIPGQADRQGILLAGSTSQSRSYVMICDAPEDIETVTLAYQASGKIAVSSAKKISRLASGLSVFGFTTSSTPQVCRLEEPSPGSTFHAIRLAADQALTSEEVGALEAELSEVRMKIEETNRKMHESRMPGQRPMRPTDRGMFERELAQRMETLSQIPRELAELRSTEAQLAGRQSMRIASMKVAELAGFSQREHEVKDGGVFDNSLLASSTKGIVAIRAGGKWVDIKRVVEESSKIIGSAKLSLSGGQSRVSLTCELFPVIPSANSSYVIVAETTLGLESQGSGSIDERLAKVSPVPFQGSGSTLSVSRDFEWGGRKTKLWVKVFDPKEPETLLLDEVILMDYPGTFAARWEKPPSAIIAIPPPQPDVPVDVVKDRSILDAKGEILDLVAAGDGSVLMVRTNREPYWAPLDLKTGKWLPAPWKAKAGTLLAAQAGNIHLIDVNSMVMETWGLASGKREGLQLLPVAGPIVAVASPLADASQPMMVVTAKAAYFLDAVNFEQLACALDTTGLFDDGSDDHYQRSPLDPASITLRASDDGVLYSLLGRRPGEQGSQLEFLTVTLDKSPIVISKSSDRQFLGSKGRNLAQYFPDHGGAGLMVMPTSSGARFPDSTGEIRITHENGGASIAVIKNPPVLPDARAMTATSLAADRGAYLDTENGVLLFPDGEKLHIMHLNFPEIEKTAAKFLLAGESLEIPLPPGTGHRLTSAEGGETVIDAAAVRWTSPDSGQEQNHRLKLEWTGELGSEISSQHEVRVLPRSPGVDVESPDGAKRISLHRRGIISGLDADIRDFAGSGVIALTQRGVGSEAWNLWTCEKIFSSPTRYRNFFGDADHIYTLGDNGKLTSYDITTGDVLAEGTLGTNVNNITTGMSSRKAILAIEQDGGSGFLLLISPDTLKPQIVDLPQEIRRRLPHVRLASNASGSAAWGKGVGIFRDDRAITVTPYPQNISGFFEGVPDIYGKQVFDGKKVFDLDAKDAVVKEVPELRGIENSTKYELDVSGRYLLMMGYDAKAVRQIVSVRDVRKPTDELFKISYPGAASGQYPLVIADSKTLVSWRYFGGKSLAFVYDFDIPQIIAEISR